MELMVYGSQSAEQAKEHEYHKYQHVLDEMSTYRSIFGH